MRKKINLVTSLHKSTKRNYLKRMMAIIEGMESPERMTKISEFLQNSQQNNTPETIEFNSNTTYGKIIKIRKNFR